MNAFLKKSLLVALAAAGVSLGFGQPPKAAPPKPVPAHSVYSVFVMPASPREGRDPFFPESPRPYEESVSATNRADAGALLIKGLSYEHGHAMVIINNHTFAVGDEGDVISAGSHVHLRLIEIGAHAAVVEINGLRREISTETK